MAEDFTRALAALLVPMLRVAVREEVAALMRPQAPDEHVTLRDAARELHQSPRGVRRLISLGRLQASRVGAGKNGRLLVSRKSIRALLDAGIR